MKKIAIAIVLTMVVSAFAQAQSKVTQTRDGAGFSSVELRMPATVYVNQDTHFSITVSAPQEWLDRISTEVDDHQLNIEIESKDWSKDFWKNKPDVIVNITMPKINGLSVSGSGTIKVQNNILTDLLTLEVSGSGIVDVAEYKAAKVQEGVYGSGIITVGNAVAENIRQEVQGSGIIKTTSIQGTLVSVSLGGSGEIRIENIAAEKLDASTEGSGNVKIVKGVVNDAALSTAGSGNVSASELVGKNVSAAVSGSGGISVGVLDSLEASIAGSGSVVYKGSPSSIHKSISGSGSVRSQ
jgi:hypothetical protein